MERFLGMAEQNVPLADQLARFAIHHQIVFDVGLGLTAQTVRVVPIHVLTIYAISPLVSVLLAGGAISARRKFVRNALRSKFAAYGDRTAPLMTASSVGAAVGTGAVVGATVALLIAPAPRAPGVKKARESCG